MIIIIFPGFRQGFRLVSGISTEVADFITSGSIQQQAASNKHIITNTSLQANFYKQITDFPPTDLRRVQGPCNNTLSPQYSFP